MTQKNFMSARALNMAELENVNGGAMRGGKCDFDIFETRGRTIGRTIGRTAI